MSQLVRLGDFGHAPAPPIALNAPALRARVRALAEDAGKLRRHLRAEENSFVDFLLDRLALHVAVLDSMASPTAAELVQAGLDCDEALGLADDAEAALQRALGRSR